MPHFVYEIHNTVPGTVLSSGGRRGGNECGGACVGRLWEGGVKKTNI